MDLDASGFSFTRLHIALVLYDFAIWRVFVCAIQGTGGEMGCDMKQPSCSTPASCPYGYWHSSLRLPVIFLRLPVIIFRENYLI